MTNQEAYKRLKEINYNTFALVEVEDEINAALSALEKQIHKKVKIIHPYEEDKNFIYKVCPSCNINNSIWLLPEAPAIKYCMWCGQALIWEEKNKV